MKVPSFESWLGLSDDHPSSGSPPRVASLEEKHTYHPGHSKGLRSSMSDVSTTRGITNVLGALCQEPNPSNIYC